MSFQTFEDGLPPSPQFAQRVEEAYAAQRDRLRENIDYTQQIEEAAEHSELLELFDADGEPIEVPYTLDYLKESLVELEETWAHCARDLKDATTAQEQAGACMAWMKHIFADDSYRGCYRLRTDFIAQAMSDLQQRYDGDTRALTEQDALPKTENTHDQQRYFEEISKDLCTAGDFYGETLDHIRDLTFGNEYIHGHEMDAQMTPQAVILQRHAHSIADAENDADKPVPALDRGVLRRRTVDYYAKELLRPYADILPNGGAGPELSWFVYHALDVALYDRESQVNQQATKLNIKVPQKDGSFASHVVQHGGWRRACHLPDVANDDDEAVANGEGTELAELAAGMGNPAVLHRAREILDELFQDYPDIATDAGEMLQARYVLISEYYDTTALHRQHSSGRY